MRDMAGRDVAGWAFGRVVAHRGRGSRGRMEVVGVEAFKEEGVVDEGIGQSDNQTSRMKAL